MDTADLRFTGKASCIVTFEDRGRGYAGTAKFDVAEGSVQQRVFLTVEADELIACRGSFVVVLENGLWSRFELTGSSQGNSGLNFYGFTNGPWIEGTGCGS